MVDREPVTNRLQLLNEEFYLQDSLSIAPFLIGCVIETSKGGVITAAIITETEAYPGYDAASHAFNRAPTKRTEAQYSAGGKLYVYQIMGLHLMTSIVVNEESIADVVFIRSARPLSGLDEMKSRRGYDGNDMRRIASGPGMLSVALGITKDDNGKAVYDNQSDIKIYKDHAFTPKIEVGTRINLGVHGTSNEESKLATTRKWRFFDSESTFLSRG